MKLGIPLLVIGVLLLIFSIPYSILMLIGGFRQISIGIVSGGILAYTPVIGVVLGLVMTTIGATRVFKD
jgi:hypothetical protein